MEPKLELLVKKLQNEFGALAEVGGDGFFYKARHREFDVHGADRVLNILNQISKEFLKEDYIEVVKYIYNIPDMLSNWRQKCVEFGADELIYNRYLNNFRIVIRHIIEEKHS